MARPLRLHVSLLCFPAVLLYFYRSPLTHTPLTLGRLLVSVLEESQSPQAIAVAAHDLGEYVRYYPRGKRSVSMQGEPD